MSRICKNVTMCILPSSTHCTSSHGLPNIFDTTVCQTFRLKRLAKHSGSSSSFGSWTFTCARASPHSRILLYSTHPSELISLSSSIWTYLFELIHLNSSLWAHPSELISLSSSIWTHLFELIPGFQTSMPTSFAKSSITILTLHASGTHTHMRLLIKWEPPSPRTTWISTALSMY